MEKRRKQPRIGAKKLYSLLKGTLSALERPIGRDRFLSILRQNSLLIKRKRRFIRTTNSNHHYKVHKNLIKGLEIVRPNQVWISDLTYLRTKTGFIYLFLISDLFSRKIIGYELSNTLASKGAIRALKMALNNVSDTRGIVHHSDRGIQYACNDYVNLLNSHKILVSMTEENHVYENSIAERINGILKEEFFLDHTFSDIRMARFAVTEAISSYNSLRPHWSLGLLTPSAKYTA